MIGQRIERAFAAAVASCIVTSVAIAVICLTFAAVTR